MGREQQRVLEAGQEGTAGNGRHRETLDEQGWRLGDKGQGRGTSEVEGREAGEGEVEGVGAELGGVTGGGVEEQGGDELQQTVLMGSASSALELPATSCSSSALTSSCSTASTMGMTMAVVDVLESHMDSSVVQHMKQSSSLEGREGFGVGGSLTARPPPQVQPLTSRGSPGPPTNPPVLAFILILGFYFILGTPRAWHRVNIKDVKMC